MSVRLSVRTEQLGGHWTDFHEILYLSIFSKVYRENSIFIKIGQELRALYMKTNIHFLSYLARSFLERKMFQTKVLETIKTHILCLIPVFVNRAVYEIMWTNNAERGT